MNLQTNMSRTASSSGYLFGFSYADTMGNGSIQRTPGLPLVVEDPCTLKPTEETSGIVAILDLDSAALSGVAFDAATAPSLSLEIAVRPIIEPSECRSADSINK